MAYDFDVAKFIPNFLLPKDEPPAQPLQLLPVQTPPPEQPALEEQVDGKNLVNSAIAAAIPKAPNPYQLEIQRGLLAQKQAFNDAKTAEQRAAAQAQANYLRDVANAAGIDVSGYGTDVSLADATKNLASQRARDIMAAMQGYYSRNSEQYYNDEYFRGIERGLSPRKAQKVAEALKGNYQAERVNYLDGLLSSYGRDGLVMNDYGNSAIADLISEDPQRATFYATIYPNAKEAYATASDIAKEATKHGYQLDLLGKGFEYDTIGREQAHNYNLQYKDIDDKHARRMLGLRYGYGQREADNALERSKELSVFQSDIDLAKESAKAKNQFALFKDKVDYIKSLQPKELTDAEKVFRNSYMAAKLYGRSDEEATKFAGEQAVKSAFYGVEGVKGTSGNSKSSDEPKMTAEQQERYNTYKNLFNVAYDTSSDEDIARLEEFVNGEDGVGKTFSPELYQGFNDSINALKGFQRKMLNDDDGATAYWIRVKDVNILEKMYPQFNFKWFWERQGGKPK